MALCNIGRTVIDALTLCYTSSAELRTELKAIKSAKHLGNMTLRRCAMPHFKQSFQIYINDGSSPKEVALIYFNHITPIDDNENEIEIAPEDTKENYVYFRLENWVLYSKKEYINEILAIPTYLGMTFHHFTRIDLAQDRLFDYVAKIKQLMKREDVATIHNGDAIDDYDQVLATIKEYRSVTLRRTKYPEYIFMQQNAVANKSNGLIVSAYNKLSEITEKQQGERDYKQYILDFYGNPKRSLHRLEVRINGANITQFINTHGLPMSEDIIFDEQLLTEMYLGCLARVIRFSRRPKSGSKNLKAIQWRDILDGKKLWWEVKKAKKNNLKKRNHQ